MLPIFTLFHRGFTAKSRQQRGVRSEHQKVLPPRNSPKVDYIQTQNFTNKNNSANQIAEMEKEINQLDIQDGVYKGGKNAPSNQNRQGSVPPRLQGGEQKGPKRYSSMRQRSLPEAATPPAPGGFSFYPNGLHSLFFFLGLFLMLLSFAGRLQFNGSTSGHPTANSAASTATGGTSSARHCHCSSAHFTG